MDWNWKEYKQQKHQFRSYYCLDCKQQKPCHTISQEYCCSCAYQIERGKAEEYSNYQQVYQRKQQEKQEHIQQLQLLKSYQGCKECGSLSVDVYSLYENSQLVCQSCRMKKEGGSSSPISFSRQQKWYKKHWKIDLNEWLENFSQLPVNAECARKWLKDKEHLNSCRCLETEAKELCELFTNSLKGCQEQLKKCACEKAEKTRTSGEYVACEECEEYLPAASKKRVIKNRHNPSFWGLEVKKKTLCLTCLKNYIEQMPANKKYTFNKYIKRSYK